MNKSEPNVSQRLSLKAFTTIFLFLSLNYEGSLHNEYNEHDLKHSSSHKALACSQAYQAQRPNHQPSIDKAVKESQLDVWTTK